MKKLALNLDDLDVRSFETAALPTNVRGTVDAHNNPVIDAVDWVLSCLLCPQANNR